MRPPEGSHREKRIKILVATDGSRGGGAALKFAARLAGKDPSSELIVLTIGRAGGSAAQPSQSMTERFSLAGQRREAKRVFEAATRLLPRNGARVRFRFVPGRRATPIPETILRQADRLRVDLVVIGSEGRDTLSEWIVGGTALRLIYLAQRPVTVVRPRRRRGAAGQRLAAALA